jgi:hypothetical protein
MRMNVFYCDTCKSKITDVDLSMGIGLKRDDDRVFCKNCAQVFAFTSSILMNPLTLDKINEAQAPAGDIKFWFCETCGKRISDSDIQCGAGKDKKLKGVYCNDCSLGVTTTEFTALVPTANKRELKASLEAARTKRPPDALPAVQRTKPRTNESSRHFIYVMTGVFGILAIAGFLTFKNRSRTNTAENIDQGTPRQFSREKLASITQDEKASNAILPGSSREHEKSSTDNRSLQKPTTANDASVLLVKFGTDSSSNTFGPLGWKNVFNDRYTTYLNDGVGGVASGTAGNYDSRGVSGPASKFRTGDSIIVTWSNISSDTITFSPKISFRVTTRPADSKPEDWHMMHELVLTAGQTNICTYTFNVQTAGEYSLVNVSSNHTSKGRATPNTVARPVLVCRKIELFSVR